MDGINGASLLSGNTGNTSFLKGVRTHFEKAGSVMIPQAMGGVLFGAGIACLAFSTPLSFSVAMGFLLGGGLYLFLGTGGAAFHAISGGGTILEALEQSFLVSTLGVVCGMVTSLSFFYLMIPSLFSYGVSLGLSAACKMGVGMASLVLSGFMLYQVTSSVGKAQPCSGWIAEMGKTWGLAIARKFVFIPPPRSYSREEEDRILKLETASGNSIFGSYCFMPGNKFTILYSHGNGEDLGRLLPFMEHVYLEQELNIFAYDYPGYGESWGTPSERGVYEAIETAYHYLVQKCRIPPGNIVLYGRGLGCGPTIELATKVAVNSVILENPFVSALRVLLPERDFFFDLFKNKEKINRMVQLPPVLFICGEEGSMIKPWHTEELFEEYQGEEKVKLNEIDKAVYLDTPGYEYAGMVTEFIREMNAEEALEENSGP